jgi:hypothetical protein
MATIHHLRFALVVSWSPRHRSAPRRPRMVGLVRDSSATESRREYARGNVVVAVSDDSGPSTLRRCRSARAACSCAGSASRRSAHRSDQRHGFDRFGARHPQRGRASAPGVVAMEPHDSVAEGARGVLGATAAASESSSRATRSSRGASRFVDFVRSAERVDHDVRWPPRNSFPRRGVGRATARSTGWTAFRRARIGGEISPKRPTIELYASPATRRRSSPRSACGTVVWTRRVT